MLYLDIVDSTKKVINLDAQNLPVTRCDYSNMIRMTSDSLGN